MSSYQQIREECLEANLLLPASKLVDLTFGNVSVADPARAIFAIKPSGVDYLALKAADIVVIDYEGHVVEGSLRPSSDAPTHRRLYQSFDGIRAVAHTHSRNAVAFAQAGREIQCLGTTHADYFYGAVPVTRALSAAETAGEYELQTGNLIVETINSRDPLATCAVLVRNHGPFVWGPSGKKAVENAIALEIIAEMAMKTLQLNPGVEPISAPLLHKHFLRKHGATAYYGQEKPGKGS